MSVAPIPEGPVVIVDAGHGIGPHLASLLAGRGLEVVAWAWERQGPAGAHADGVGGGDPVTWLHGPSIERETLAKAGAVIFNISALDEPELMSGGGLADAIAADAAFFTRTLQAVSRAMIERGSGQIWVLSVDDSFSYYLPLPAAPITHHTRVGAIRALAKELARFGVSANAAVLQPGPEATQPEVWQAARAGVGSYAQKFKPFPLASVADTLAFWLTCQALPMNGSVLHFGNGVYDGNL